MTRRQREQEKCLLDEAGASASAVRLGHPNVGATRPGLPGATRLFVALAKLTPCATISGMLIPRFTIRWLFGLMTVSSFFFLVVSFAYQRQLWAIAVSVAVASVVVVFFFYGLAFMAAWLVASVAGFSRTKTQIRSPFASAGPPPQIIPPQEPE